MAEEKWSGDGHLELGTQPFTAHLDSYFLPHLIAQLSKGVRSF